MLIYQTEAHRSHSPQSFLVKGRMQATAEQPERADRLLAAVTAAGGHEFNEPAVSAADLDAAIGAVHEARYLAFLRDGPALWAVQPGAGPEILPNVHPNRHMGHYPTGIVGIAGWHMADTACPITAGTWPAARASASCAVAATVAVLAGSQAAYALCRPPGHHAYADMAGGFCYLNNSAIAAELARTRHSRVAILDVDVHHGNGTQGIFWQRGDVLTVSIHAEPAGFYPFYAGFADEQGEGPGQGANLNLPQKHGIGDADYFPVLETALAAIRKFDPGFLVVALGLDAGAGDPVGVLKITEAGFAEIARRIAGLKLPTALIQEGGYLSDALGANLAAFLRGFGD